MAGNYAVASKNAMLDALTATIGYVSAHTADPGSSGTSEVTGGSPAYARKAVTWSSATGGVASASGLPTFDIPTSTTVTYLGLWSAVTGGTYKGKIAISSQAFSSQGTLPIASIALDLNSVASA